MKNNTPPSDRSANYPCFEEDFKKLLDSVQDQLSTFMRQKGYPASLAIPTFGLSVFVSTFSFSNNPQDRTEFLDTLFKVLENDDLLPDGYQVKGKGDVRSKQEKLKEALKKICDAEEGNEIEKSYEIGQCLATNTFELLRDVKISTPLLAQGITMHSLHLLQLLDFLNLSRELTNTAKC